MTIVQIFCSNELANLRRQAAGRRLAALAGIALTLLLASLAIAQPAHASGIAQAQAGRVLGVAYGRAVPQQQSYSDRAREYDRYQQPTTSSRGFMGSTLGSVLGSAIGITAGRHSRTGRMYGGVAGAAIGAAIGNEIDRRRQTAQTWEIERRRMREQAIEDADSEGAQVIVQLRNGQTVAVFERGASRFQRGQKVWLIGNDQLIPAE